MMMLLILNAALKIKGYLKLRLKVGGNPWPKRIKYIYSILFAPGRHEPPIFAIQHRASAMQYTFHIKTSTSYKVNLVRFVKIFELSADTFLKQII